MGIENLKKSLNRIKGINEGAKGYILRSYFQYIKNQKGQDGALLVENLLDNIGISLKLNNLKAFYWYLRIKRYKTDPIMYICNTGYIPSLQ